MAFPVAGAEIYYNEEGEPLGWDYPGYDEPADPDDFDQFEDYDYDDTDEQGYDDEPDIHDPAHEQEAPPWS